MINENILDSKSITLIISLVSNGIIGIYLWFKITKIDIKTQRYFAMATISIAIWSLSSWVNHFSTEAAIVTIFSRISYAIMMLAVLFMLQFIKAFTKQVVNTFSIIILSLLIVTATFTPYVISAGIIATPTSVEAAIFGSFFSEWTIASLCFGIILIVEFALAVKKSQGLRKARLQYLAGLLILIISLVLTFNVLLPLFQVTSFIFIGQLATVLFALGSFWLFLQDKMYSLKYFLATILAQFTTGTILFLLSSGTQRFEQYVLGWDISDIKNINVIITGILIGTALVNILPSLITEIRNKIYKVTNIQLSSFERVRNELIEYSDNSVSIDAYINSILDGLRLALQSELVILYINELEDKYWSGRSLQNESTYINSKGKFQIYNENANKDVAVTYTLSVKDDTFGVLLFGHKENYSIYTKEELDQIKSIGKLLSTAVSRHIIYKKVDYLTENLQEQVDSQIKQIQLKNTQLQDTLRKERDMLDILGHELRTPMSIARNAISLLKSNIDKDTLDDEKLNKYINMADENIRRETKLLETMLSTTKLDKGDLGLDLEKVDLNDVIADSIEGLKQKATEKGLDIKYNSEDQIYVYADRSRIQEVVDNLVDNAVKYTKKGHVEIKIYKQGDKAAIEVNDTGIGIPENDLPNLGKKFFRVDTYIEAEEKAQSMDIIRPGGTGLGLYVIVNLVKAMDGSIDIQSKVDVGSNFTLTFPIFTGQAVKSIQKDITKLDKITEYKNRMAKKELN